MINRLHSVSSEMLPHFRTTKHKPEISIYMLFKCTTQISFQKTIHGNSNQVPFILRTLYIFNCLVHYAVSDEGTLRFRSFRVYFQRLLSLFCSNFPGKIYGFVTWLAGRRRSCRQRMKCLKTRMVTFRYMFTFRWSSQYSKNSLLISISFR